MIRRPPSSPLFPYPPLSRSVPGYLATVSGANPAGGSRRVDPQMLARGALFVATFSLIFILLGLAATAVGAFLFRNQRSEEHTSELQSQSNLVCRLLLETTRT